MMQQAIVVGADNAPRALNVVGEEVTVLASGAQTGSYEIFRQIGREGSGPPPHSHPWDEAFYVIRGEISFGAGDKELIGRPGTLVHLPAGTVHWFRFGVGGGEMLSVTSREGASKMFTDFDREIDPDKLDPGKLVEVAGRYGAKISAPAG